MNTTNLVGCLQNFPIWEWLGIGDNDRESLLFALAIFWLSECLRAKTSYGLSFVVMNVEDSVKFRDLQKVGHLFVDAQEL
jgi:hypothetical protein